MGRKPAITYEAFVRALGELQDAGADISIEHIRSRIGGSYSTLTKFMRLHREESAAAQRRGVPVPEALVCKMTAAINELWSTAVMEAESRLSGQRELMAATLADSEKERDEAIASADRQAENVEVLEAKLIELDVALNAAKDELMEVRHRLSSEQEKTREVISKVTSLREELVMAHKERAAAREEAARLVGQLESATNLWTTFAKDKVSTISSNAGAG